MGAFPRVVVAIVFVLLLKDRILKRMGQLWSLALWGASQLVQQIGRWVQVGPFLQARMVHGWSYFSWASVQIAQRDGFLHRVAGCT